MFSPYSRSLRSLLRLPLALEQLEDRVVPTAGWAINLPNTVWDSAVDDSGAVFVTGHFTGNADLDPGPGVANLTSTSGDDGYVAKYAADGSFLWASRFGTHQPRGIAVAGGAVYVGGIFTGSSDFGSTVLNSAGDNDGFVARLDAATGSFTWAVKYGGTSQEQLDDLATDPSGNLIVAGAFSATVDFDPGPGVSQLNAVGGANPVIWKLDAGGNFLWVRSSSGTNGFASGVATDVLGNVYVHGGITGATSFGSFPVGAGIYTAKLNASGTFLWANSQANLSTDDHINLAVDDHPANPADWTVYFGASVSVTNALSAVKLTASNGSTVWMRTFADSNYGSYGTGFAKDIKAVAVAGDGGVYVAGYFYEMTLDFDPGPGTAYLDTVHSINGSPDVFLLRLDEQGNYVSGRNMGGAYFDNLQGITTAANGDVVLNGRFGNGAAEPLPPTGEFDVGSHSVILDKANGSGFLVRLDPNYSAITGRVIRDANGNGLDDDGFGLQGWTVYLDQNNNGHFDSGELSAVTGLHGIYRFAHLPAGTYTVAQVPRAGWTLTTPASTTVSLANGQFHSQTFGNTTATTVRTYSSTDVPKATVNGQFVSSTLTIPDNFNILDLDVRVSVTHNKVQELQIRLRGPDGRDIELVFPNYSAATGKHFTNTILDQDAAKTIAEGKAPYTGRFRPVPSFGGNLPLDWLDGQLTAGTWTLEIKDYATATTGTLTAWSLLVTTTVGSLIQEPIGPPPGQPSTNFLTTNALQPIIAEAIARFKAAGLDAASIALLRATPISIGDLGGRTLGMHTPSGVWIDDNAAGRGWFVDPTPSDDSEFRKRGNQGEKQRIDLLTVVMHEMGHVLGFEHDADGMMRGALNTGIRKHLDDYFTRR